MKRQALVFNLANLLILLPLFVVSLSVGAAEFHWSAVFSSSDSMQLMLISRLPRTFAVVLSGVSLAVAGMIMQILMKNRFVEPSMVGASQSAALALLLMMLFAPSVAPLLRMSGGGGDGGDTAVYGVDFAPAADGAVDGAAGGGDFRRGD